MSYEEYCEMFEKGYDEARRERSNSNICLIHPVTQEGNRQTVAFFLWMDPKRNQANRLDKKICPVLILTISF